MNIENANDHPFKVVKVEEGGPYANSHPYKVEVVGGGEGGTSDFNKLDNRPKYNGTVMTGDTNIPEVVSYTAGDSVDITNDIISATNTGKAKVLTTADYNWHATGDVDNRIAAWLLPDGVYVVKNSPVVWFTTSDNDSGLTFIKGTTSNGAPYLLTVNNAGSVVQYTLRSTGSTMNERPILKQSDIIDNLTSTSTAAPLSANQGKVLNDKIGDLSTLTTTDKTSAVAAINEIAASAGGGGVTELTSADYNWPTNNPTSVALWKLNSGTYMWGNVEVKASSSTDVSSDHFAIVGEKQTGGGIVDIISLGDGSSQTSGNYNLINTYTVEYSNGNLMNSKYALTRDNVVQTTGTSTTGVMSQNAVTSMVFADPSTKQQVQIGNTSNHGTGAITIGNTGPTYGNNSISIGLSSQANAAQAIAFAGGQTTMQGVMQIGLNQTGWTGVGYNNSDYRLLTGLYDGQSAHDAATVAQGNTLSTSAPTATTGGVLGQLYTDTTNMHTYQCTAIDDTTDPNNPVYTWTMRW